MIFREPGVWDSDGDDAKGFGSENEPVMDKMETRRIRSREAIGTCVRGNRRVSEARDRLRWSVLLLILTGASAIIVAEIKKEQRQLG